MFKRSVCICLYVRVCVWTRDCSEVTGCCPVSPEMFRSDLAGPLRLSQRWSLHRFCLGCIWCHLKMKCIYIILYINKYIYILYNLLISSHLTRLIDCKPLHDAAFRVLTYSDRVWFRRQDIEANVSTDCSVWSDAQPWGESWVFPFSFFSEQWRPLSSGESFWCGGISV